MNGSGGPIVQPGSAWTPEGAGPAPSAVPTSWMWRWTRRPAKCNYPPTTPRIQDAGKAIHPSYVEGQMQGAVVQGIGWALNEEYYFNQDQGQMANSSFLDYRMPTSLDLPMIEHHNRRSCQPGSSLRSPGRG